MGIYEKIKPFHLDVLKEAGNIGAGNAATALSQLLNKKINIEVPSVRLVDFEEAKNLAGGEETVVAATFLRIIGEAPGSMFIIFQQEEAEELAYTLTGNRVEITKDSIDEMTISALQELGNILAGNYLSAISQFLSLPMQPSVPSLAVDMAGALLDTGLVKASLANDHVIVIDTVMKETDKNVNVSAGQLFLLPDPEAFKRIFQALGVEL